MKRKITVVDLFCGGGGESTGIHQAAMLAGYDIKLTAVNHWERAIETHAANHPAAEHYCESIERLDPTKIIPNMRLDLLWASPECTHHSNARGGRPRSDQSRASPWLILKWLQELCVERVIIENVPEFTSWGPLDRNGRPIQRQKGSTFRAFIQSLRSLNYTVDWRILCAADYGAHTSRRRLFIQAVKGRKKILWPDITHTKEENNIFQLPPWKPSLEIIDWTIPIPSIFSRKKPLAPATIRRIEYGIRKYWREATDPFLAVLYKMGTTRNIDNCPPTKKPFIIEYYGNGQSHPLTIPLPTITTKDRFSLVVGNDSLDIGFRMLQPHELAAATGFPNNYKFCGTKAEKVKQIGNAVPPAFARAMFSTILGKEVRK